MTHLQQILKNNFNYDQFRPGQEQTISQLLAGQSSLAIFPTGSGKSLCYQLTATQLPHLTLVVSPLLALMQDQLQFLQSKGIAAHRIDSSLTPEQNQAVMASVQAGQVKILMVSVERFKNERFRSFIQQIPISMLVIDEAHCISEWGHNFRPDYLKLPQYRQALKIPNVLLLTATATKTVKRDMAAKFAIAEANIVQTGFYRSNLTLQVLPVLAAHKDQQLLQQINTLKGAGIVYVTLQHSAEQVAAQLQQSGVKAEAYHAGLGSEIRQQVQQRFMIGQTQIVVATIAFGMGIDKSDIRFVIHYDLPKSIENYSQEIGRAGRDGAPAHCITLANLDGLITVENFVYADTPEQTSIQKLLTTLNRESENNQWELQINQLSRATNIKQLPLKTLLVQLELHGIIQPMYSYFADFKYKFIQSEAQILASFTGERHHLLASIFNHTQFKKIWGEPDFELIYQATQSNRQRVVAALEYLQQKQLITLETKQMTDVYRVIQPNIDIESLSQTLFHYFLANERKEIKRIATLIRFFELNRCLSYNLSLYFDDHHAPQSCGHCSVCQGHVAQLQYSSISTIADDQQLITAMSDLDNQLKGQMTGVVSTENYCRFLAGMGSPLFTANKVKKLSGFGLCAQHRYDAIRKTVQRLKMIE